MSFQKSHIYNVKFLLKSLEANCQRAACKVHALLTIDNEQRKFPQVVDMRRNTAVFNSELEWELVVLKYDEVSGTYEEKLAVLKILYDSPDSNSASSKLKVGHLTLNLAKILNARNYRINSTYPLEKCYDPEAKLKISVDFTRVEETSIQSVGESVPNEYHRLKQSMLYKNSKMRERMMDEEKNLLQEKLFDYEDKMEKYRSSHNEQIKKLSEQLERKEERIVSLANENHTLLSSFQNTQINNERLKNKLTAAESQNHELKEAVKQAATSKQNSARELASLQLELATLSSRLEQQEKAWAKKESYYKQEVEKYNGKYIESENSRNKIIFDMENKLKEQLDKKDSYYKIFITNLEQKMQGTSHSSKESLHLKEKELLVIREQQDSYTKEIKQLTLQMQGLEEDKFSANNIITELEGQVARLRLKLKAMEDEHEFSIFSNESLNKELQKQRAEHKHMVKAQDELKYELELANRTLEENERTIVKMSREIQVFREREFYMEEKYQDQLEIKSYNEDCIKGTAIQYKNQLKRCNYQIKELQQKADDLESSLAASNAEKQRVREECKNHNRVIFELNQDILRLQNDLNNSRQKAEDLELSQQEKEGLIKELMHKMQVQSVARNNEVNSLVANIEDLEYRLKEMSEEKNESFERLEYRLNDEMEERSRVVAGLEAELRQARMHEQAAKDSNQQKAYQYHQLELELRTERDKVQGLEREVNRLRFDSAKRNEKLQAEQDEAKSLKRDLEQAKSELSTARAQNTKLNRKLIKQKESYIEIIKWVLDRSYSRDVKEFIQSIDADIEIDIITLVNSSLERTYQEWERKLRQIDELKDENNRLRTELTSKTVEVESLQDNIRGDSFVEGFAAIKQKISIAALRPPNQALASVDATRLEQLREANNSLQRDLSHKIAEIEGINNELFDERERATSLQEEVRYLKEDIEELNSTLDRKNAQIRSMQSQLEMQDGQNYHQSYRTQSPVRVNHKEEIESKFRSKKAIEESETKLQQSARENSLLKAKVQLLQSKLKSITEQLNSLQKRNDSLVDESKTRESAIKGLEKELEEERKCHEKVNKELELVRTNLHQRVVQLEENKVELEKLKKINEILTKETEDSEHRHSERQKQLEKECQVAKRALVEIKEALSEERLEKERMTLEVGSQIGSLKGATKEAERRVASLEGLLKKSKEQYDELYLKHLGKLSELNEAEEKIKDYKMDASVKENSYEKKLQDMVSRLQEKQFELEELKFTSESKIIQLERELEELIQRR